MRTLLVCPSPDLGCQQLLRPLPAPHSLKDKRKAGDLKVGFSCLMPFPRMITSWKVQSLAWGEDPAASIGRENSNTKTRTRALVVGRVESFKGIPAARYLHLLGRPQAEWPNALQTELNTDSSGNITADL